MRAAVLRGGEMVVRDDLPDPKPGHGQVLVGVKACGICGSDLHFARHGGRMLALAGEAEGMSGVTGGRLDLSRDVFMGHEFAGEVLEVGPDTQSAVKPGALVTSVPMLIGPSGAQSIVYSNEVLGGYSERMLLSAPLLLEVPNGLEATRAALTEPMAVGLHAVNRSGIAERQGAVVIGCGPVGLAVIAALRLRAVEPIVAADFSPARRELAKTMGAHVAVDPRDEGAFRAWRRRGEGGAPPVAFEAVGVAGVLNEILKAAPPQSRVVVVGVCMEDDTINPYFGIGKELNLQFVLGYSPGEFAQALRSIAEGDIDVGPLVTGEVGLDGVADAFAALAEPEMHCKILVKPEA